MVEVLKKETKSVSPFIDIIANEGRWTGGRVGLLKTIPVIPHHYSAFLFIASEIADVKRSLASLTWITWCPMLGSHRSPHNTRIWRGAKTYYGTITKQSSDYLPHPNRSKLIT